MCVIFFYVNSNPSTGCYKLILASNRDEFYARDTQAAAKWANAEYVYGGIDLEPGREGGTWLAISGRDGIIKVGALLNLTGEPKPRHAEAHSVLQAKNYQNNNTNNNNNITATTTTTTNHLLLGRGMIVSDFVISNAANHAIENYNRRLVDDCTKYSAFSFLSIEIGSSAAPAKITHCSNVPPTLTHYVEGQCYGLGNSLPQVPFAKVHYGQQRFEQIVTDFTAKQQNLSNIDNAEQTLVNELMSLLKCKQKFWPDPELQRRAPNWGEHLSALNVDIPHEGYGSRTHTVILLDANNKMHFYEETMKELDQNGAWAKTHIEKQFAQ